MNVSELSKSAAKHMFKSSSSKIHPGEEEEEEKIKIEENSNSDSKQHSAENSNEDNNTNKTATHGQKAKLRNNKVAPEQSQKQSDQGKSGEIDCDNLRDKKGISNKNNSIVKSYGWKEEEAGINMTAVNRRSTNSFHSRPPSAALYTGSTSQDDEDLQSLTILLKEIGNSMRRAAPNPQKQSAALDETPARKSSKTVMSLSDINVTNKEAKSRMNSTRTGSSSTEEAASPDLENKEPEKSCDESASPAADKRKRMTVIEQEQYKAEDGSVVMKMNSLFIKKRTQTNLNTVPIDKKTKCYNKSHEERRAYFIENMLRECDALQKKEFTKAQRNKERKQRVDEERQRLKEAAEKNTRAKLEKKDSKPLSISGASIGSKGSLQSTDLELEDFTVEETSRPGTSSKNSDTYKSTRSNSAASKKSINNNIKAESPAPGKMNEKDTVVYENELDKACRKHSVVAQVEIHHQPTQTKSPGPTTPKKPTQIKVQNLEDTSRDSSRI